MLNLPEAVRVHTTPTVVMTTSTASHVDSKQGQYLATGYESLGREKPKMLQGKESVRQFSCMQDVKPKMNLIKPQFILLKTPDTELRY